MSIVQFPIYIVQLNDYYYNMIKLVQCLMAGLMCHFIQAEQYDIITVYMQ